MPPRGSPGPVANLLPFLLYGLRADVEPDRWSARVDHEDAWTAVAVHAMALGLAPLLHERVGPALPPRTAARFAAARAAQRDRNASVIQQAGEVLDAAAVAGLEPIVLKGAHLAAAVYPEPALRPMNDIDLLIPPERIGALEGVLESLGYEAKRTDPDLGPGVVKHTSTWRRPGDEGSTPNPYLSAAAGRIVEPHTSLTESWFGLRVDITPGLWSRTVEVRVDGRSWRVLAPEDLLLHLSVHLTFALIMGAPSAVQIADFAVVPEAVGADWDEVAERAVETGAAAVVLGALHLATTLVGTVVPLSTLRRLEDATPGRVQRRVRRIDADYVTARTQQAPLSTLTIRLRRGLTDRIEAARWTTSRREQGRVALSALRIGRTDTVRLLTRRSREGG